jgi:hypothetical protein
MAKRACRRLPSSTIRLRIVPLPDGHDAHMAALAPLARPLSFRCFGLLVEGRPMRCMLLRLASAPRVRHSMGSPMPCCDATDDISASL